MTTLLCDSDIFAFKFAAKNQIKTPWGNWTYPDNAEDLMDEYVADLMQTLKADKAIMCLTHDKNFRHAVMPEYKPRDRTERPELLKPLKEYLASEYPSYIRPDLEADDIMGILQTHPFLIADDTIIVSEDKDMRTVPGKLYNPRRPELGVIDVTDIQAKAFHMWQTICGDTTDGFKGAPRVGKKSIYATAVLTCDEDEMWNCVLDAYASVGATEHDALVNARMAKILTWRNYDFQTKEVKLWTPVELLYPSLD
jgi:DNA polymerase-1